jgi:hypothetical protein
MSNPLTFLLPFRYDTVRNVLLVQSAPVDLALEAAARVRALFPGCHLEGVLRDSDRAAAAPGVFDRVTLVRWEDRREILRRLRHQRYDAVVILLSRRGGSDYLRLMPYLLRTRAILVFNDRLDYFPVHATRLATLAHHVTGRTSLGALTRWAVARAVLYPATLTVLLASVARLHLRAAFRRARLGPARRPHEP